MDQRRKKMETSVRLAARRRQRQRARVLAGAVWLCTVQLGHGDVIAAPKPGVAATSPAAAAAPKVPATPNSAVRPSVHVRRPPHDVLASWLPLHTGPATAAVLSRPELAGMAKALRAKRWAQACRRAEKALSSLEHQAARLFYAPSRKGADVVGIDHFLLRYVRSAAAQPAAARGKKPRRPPQPPLLEISGELFVPAAAWRDATVRACVRAKLPQVADRFLAHAALTHSGHGRQRLRTALALVRWQATGAISPWLLSGGGGGAATWLLRAAMVAKSERATPLAFAQRAGGSAALRDARRWLRALD